ncbi:MAG: paraquat-inducible protein A [Epsilonproteobacteria bacterium]|nr:paraquat-inducible protein A [Campylobacterota bacterium]
MKQPDLDSLVLCEKCHTLHKKKPLSAGEKAVCATCKSTLYRYHSHLLCKIISFSLAALIFFALFLFFPIVTVEISQNSETLSVFELIKELYKSRFWMVASLVSLTVVFFPLAIHILYLSAATFLKLKIFHKITKNILRVLAHLIHWNMADIFLISFFVAMVKLIGYAKINLGIALFALTAFVGIDLYLTRYIKLRYLWDIWDEQRKK